MDRSINKKTNSMVTKKEEEKKEEEIIKASKLPLEIETKWRMVEGYMSQCDWNDYENNLRDCREIHNFPEELIQRYFKQNNISPKKPEDNKTFVLLSKFSPKPYGDELIEYYNFILDKYKRFWRYDSQEGIWKEDAEEIIKWHLRTRMFGDEQQKSHYTKEIVYYIKDTSYDPKIEQESFSHLIAFKNCIYNMDTGKIKNFSPKYFLTNKISAEIDNKFSSCDIIDAFFGDVVGEKYKEILYDLCAYCLINGQPYQKLFFLTGTGANGKSTFLEMLRKFLGQGNVSSISPHEMCGGDSWSLGEMWNKMANISTDISYELLKNINKVKEITGGDTVRIQRKFKDGFPSVINAKQIFATNQPPIVTDKTHAWYRRIYLIEFPKRFEGKARDPEMLKKITTQREMNGLAWKCIKYLKGLKDRNFVFGYDIDTDKLTKVYEDLSNPLNRFVKENTEEDPEGKIWKFEFREKFEHWLKEKSLRIWNDKEIGMFMKELYDDQRLTYEQGFGNIPDKRYRAWVGLKWNPVQPGQDVQGIDTYSIYYRPTNRVLDIMDTPVSEGKKFG